jgi:hypothetical protein
VALLPQNITNALRHVVVEEKVHRAGPAI